MQLLPCGSETSETCKLSVSRAALPLVLQDDLLKALKPAAYPKPPSPPEPSLLAVPLLP